MNEILFKPSKWTVSVTIVLLFLGFLLSIQFRTQQELKNDLRFQKDSDLRALWKQLSDTNSKLNQQRQELSAQIREYETSVNNDHLLSTKLEEEIHKLKMATGQIPVQGSGITVRIPDNSESTIIYVNLVDIINELLAAGAEAVAVNNRRVMHNTPIGYTITDNNKYHITVNNQIISPPIIIQAIGHPDTLEAGLRLPGGIMDNLSFYGIALDILKSEKLQLPSWNSIELPPFNYAKTKKAKGS